ncbi:MAG: glycosyltransferase, partial [Chloroflexus sp.]|nr:glycosyltransferase [Chloroflexus sp.]
MIWPKPDVSIIIVNWNTRQLLLDCLAVLPEATNGLETEIWVVDNGSRDGSVEAVQRYFPDVFVIANPDNRGFATANNQAIRASSGRYVM